MLVSSLLPFGRRSAIVGIALACGTSNLAAQRGSCAGNTVFHVGSGIYDITGPAAELGMMGYGKGMLPPPLGQKTAGIHQRLRSRAFVVASPCNGKRVVFVSADLGMLFQSVKQQVMEHLRMRYKDTYTDANVVLSATHTHSGPGGYSHYALYNVSVLGFDKQNFEAIVDGIVQSIVRAHDNLAAGTIRINAGDLAGVGINRSREAYLANPVKERAKYTHETDVTMTLLRLQGANGQDVGAITWFALHPTSMGNDNLLISGDNKGYASYLFEKAKGTNYLASRTFVAAFAQSNEGDVSPNIHGGTNGGGANDFESTERAATRQYEMAKSLYDNAREQVAGGVDYRHTYARLDAIKPPPAYCGGLPCSTCPASIGVSMIAGAEDGPGLGEEGATCEELRKHGITGFRCSPVKTSCQEEKAILLVMAESDPPLTPEVLPVQVVTLGNLALVAVPFEVTTMAGRRLRETVLKQLAPMGVKRVVIVGLANAYAGYVTTREEYARQHYEGASTHFGPWTLAALQHESEKLAAALHAGADVPRGPAPRDLRSRQTTLQTGVVFDDKPLTAKFGDLVLNANALYSRGQTVTVKFWGGHPKNNLRRQGSFLQVQRRSGASWVAVAHDWDWETKYRWERASCGVSPGCSHVTVEWKIPANAAPGIYRIRHDGDWKSGVTGTISSYTGYSREFTVN